MRSPFCRISGPIRRGLVALFTVASLIVYIQVGFPLLWSQATLRPRSRLDTVSDWPEYQRAEAGGQGGAEAWIQGGAEGGAEDGVEAGAEGGGQAPAVSAVQGDELAGSVLQLKYRGDSDTNYTATPLLLLFSSWVHTDDKTHVHHATTRLWASWPCVRPAVLTDDHRVQQSAGAAGWLVSGQLHVRPACHGPPVLVPMYIQLMRQHAAHYYSFSNADILYGEGLVDTLHYLHQHDAWRDRPLLIVGRRYNVDFLNTTGMDIQTPRDVARLTSRGSLVLRSTDFFITNKHFPWAGVPEVSVGRPYVVRVVLGYAASRHVPVIDATRTIEAVHLTTGDGNYASWHKPGVQCNQKLLFESPPGDHRPLPLGLGHCECARLETVREPDGQIRVRRRKPNPTICHS